jgi:predicted CDP-diglyceride synthetase/phosphatidate cytidylyltransferase
MLFMPVDAPDNAAIPFVTFGFILVFLAGARLYHDENNFLQDERTRKIGAYGLSWSWFLTFIVLFGFFWLDYLDIYKPDAGALSVILILVMGVSAKVFQWYLFRKGDVE